MDFVISKVAMSICALLVAGGLASVLTGSEINSSRTELSEIISEFCDLADCAYMSGSQGSIEWSVPTMSDGSRIVVTVDESSVRGESSDTRVVLRPSCDLHSWPWDGSRLNESAISDNDANSKEEVFESGDGIVIRTVLLQVGNESELLVFVNSIIERLGEPVR